MKRYEIKLINSDLWLAASPPSTAVTEGVKKCAVGRDAATAGGAGRYGTDRRRDKEETSFSRRRRHHGGKGGAGGGLQSAEAL